MYPQVQGQLLPHWQLQFQVAYRHWHKPIYYLLSELSQKLPEQEVLWWQVLWEVSQKKDFELYRNEFVFKSDDHKIFSYSISSEQNKQFSQAHILPALSLGGSKNAMNPKKIKSFSSSIENVVTFGSNFLKNYKWRKFNLENCFSCSWWSLLSVEMWNLYRYATATTRIPSAFKASARFFACCNVSESSDLIVPMKRILNKRIERERNQRSQIESITRRIFHFGTNSECFFNSSFATQNWAMNVALKKYRHSFPKSIKSIFRVWECAQ